MKKSGVSSQFTIPSTDSDGNPETWVRERQLALPREFQTATLEEEEHLVTSGSFAPLASGIGPSTSIFQTDSKSEKGDASPPPASRTEMVLNLCSVQLNRLRVISEEKEEKVYWLLDLEEAARLIREMLESARKWRVKQDSAILLVCDFSVMLYHPN